MPSPATCPPPVDSARLSISFHVATAIYRKLTRTEQFNAASLASPREDMAALRRLGVSLIQTFAREAAVRNNRFVLLLIPSPDIPGRLGRSLTMMMEAVGSQPGICMSSIPRPN